KGNVDDVRNSPSFEIIDLLNSEGYKVQTFDPYVKQEQVEIKLSTFEESLKNAELMIILTDHDEFKNMDWNQVKKLMNNATVFDTKNCIQNYNTEIDYYNFGNLYTLAESLLVHTN